MNNNTLPFPRGETYFEGDSSRATSVGVEHLVGREYVVADKDYGLATNNGTYANVTLRTVQNQSDGTLTLAGKGVRYGSLAKDLGRNIAGFVNARGLFGHLPDDRYPEGKTIINNDIFYVVTDGPVKARTSSTQSNAAAISRHGRVSFDGHGRVCNALATNNTVGQSDTSAGTANSNKRIVVWTGRPFRINA